MSQKGNNSATLWMGLVVATVATAAAAYAGYKALKNIDNLDLDDIFENMNETFFSTLNKTEGE